MGRQRDTTIYLETKIKTEIDGNRNRDRQRSRQIKAWWEHKYESNILIVPINSSKSEGKGVHYQKRQTIC